VGRRAQTCISEEEIGRVVVVCSGRSDDGNLNAFRVRYEHGSLANTTRAHSHLTRLIASTRHRVSGFGARRKLADAGVHVADVSGGAVVVTRHDGEVEQRQV